jgi:hypothetical protein
MSILDAFSRWRGRRELVIPDDDELLVPDDDESEDGRWVRLDWWIPQSPPSSPHP